jgi:hypothetical protein
MPVKEELTLILLTWKIWQASNNASRWQIGFNSELEGLITKAYNFTYELHHVN